MIIDIRSNERYQPLLLIRFLYCLSIEFSPGFFIPGRYEVCLNIIAVIAKKFLRFPDWFGGEDSNNLAPSRVVHLAISDRGQSFRYLLEIDLSTCSSE